MNPGVEYYRPFGLQASGYITFAQNPAVDAEIVVDDVTYVAGTTFTIGDGPAQTAANFAAAVNADRTGYGVTHTALLPNRSVFAIFYGNKVVIVATQPGTAGNSIVLTSDTDAVLVSAGTLGGGVDGPTIDVEATITTVGTAAPAIADCTDLTWASYERTATGSAIRLAVGSPTNCRQAIVHADKDNEDDVFIGPDSLTRLRLIPGQAYNIPTIPGGRFDLYTWYLNGTADDTVVVLYVA